ncbi:ROK family protein [Prolixibacter sp. NT017]|uniref:ROK family protein n=1 Tax=Prolixibacter sp. NT017 TaxID=2652390 RepID=UPI001281B815|nr:ROK family protein [Prolixibacter sp. NT017]GET24001.1 hypothetical protein NT017_03300 [Prolixibacter sp. NT017]
MKRYAIGADIGGSHISCALVDMVKGCIVESSRAERKIDNQSSANNILNGWEEALKQAITGVDPDSLSGIGFAMPGPFAYDKGIALFEKVAKFESLYGVNVQQELATRLELSTEASLRFMNDASAFAVGEAWQGQAMGTTKSVSITLGTGFGSAFVLDGVPVVEGDGVPEMGCVWHLPFMEGIADDYFSTRWFVARWADISGEIIAGVKDVAEQAILGQLEARELFMEFGSNLGVFLGPWLKDFEAETLVIGGNVMGAWSLFGPAFKAELSSLKVETRVVSSGLREDAAIIGSARMLDSVYWRHIEPVLSKM